MAVTPSPFGPKPQFVDAAGSPDLSCKLFFYVAGSNTKQNTYTDSTGGTPNANPIILNALGQPPNEIWFTVGQYYKVVLAPSTDTDPPTSPIWTIDNLQGMGTVTTTTAQDEWILYAGSPTFLSTTSFSVTGNQTATFQATRRVKTTNTSGTIYSRIVSSVFGAVTTVTVENDSGVLDVGLSAVSYGLLSATNPSIPETAVGKSLRISATALDARAVLETEPGLVPVVASVAANALTLTINPCLLNFRSSTLTVGTSNARTVSAAVSVVVPNTATLGMTNAQGTRLAILAIDNAGTVEAAVINLSGGVNIDEAGVISTTTMSVTADLATVAYSTTGRASVPYRVVGFIDITEATAGTWAAAPTLVRGIGGEALAALSSIGYGQTWQDVVASRVSGTTYYNTTGRPIFVNVASSVNAGTGTTTSATVGAVVVAAQTISAINSGAAVSFIVPPGQSYSATTTYPPALWAELR